MELRDLLLEMIKKPTIWDSDIKTVYGQDVVEVKDINRELAQNKYKVQVKSSYRPEDEIPYDSPRSGVPGKGKVPLECKVNPNHKISTDNKLDFNTLGNRIEKDNPICYDCADINKQRSPGTSQSELDIAAEIEKFMQNVINKNKDVEYKIHFGRNKFKTNILTTNSENKGKKQCLDYDIYIKDGKDGSKNIAINIDGPSHRIRNTSVRADDVKRTIENYKANQNFVILPDTKAGDSDFKEKVEEIKRFLLSAYNAWGGFGEDALKKKLEKRGLSPEAVNDIINKKKSEHEERLNTASEKAKYGLKDEAVRKKINDLIYVLLNNNQNYDYQGKHADLIDYLRKDPSSSHSFAYYNNSWKELEDLKSRDKIQDWINAHQAKNSKWLFKKGAGGVKLFEEKK